MLQGATAGEKIYRYLYNVYQNHYGVSALMGYLHDKSGLDPKSVDDNLKRKLKLAGKPYCTDATYSEAVDDEIISKQDFIHPYAGKEFGYGLAQWEDAKIKAAFYDYMQSRKVSISNLEVQLEFFLKQMREDNKSVHDGLIRAKSVRTASDLVLLKMDKPVKATDKMKMDRARVCEGFYQLYAPLMVKTPNRPSTITGSTSQSREIFDIDDTVIVNGCIFGNGNGTGTVVEKKNATMYVSSLVDPGWYPYYIGVAAVKGGSRQGWTNAEHLKKVHPSTVVPIREHVTNKQPKSMLKSLAGEYIANKPIYMRSDAGTTSEKMVILPVGQLVVSREGKYTSYKGTKWMYVETILKKVRYVGFCSVEYLERKPDLSKMPK